MRAAHCFLFLPVLSILTAICSWSGEVAAIEYWPVDEITAERGTSTLSKWVADHRKNVLTRRENSCFQLFIANSKVPFFLHFFSFLFQLMSGRE